MTDIALLAKAFDFAAQKHIDQRRKGANAEPYINHPAEVAHILAASGASLATVAAGMLHDTIEDTETTYEELKREFGENIADIVRECSDDKSLPKAERKRLQAETALHKSDEARQVKIADKISNLRSILKSPPDGWGTERKLEYFNWSKSVVDNCRGINGKLEREFDAVYKSGLRQLQP